MGDIYKKKRLTVIRKKSHTGQIAQTETETQIQSTVAFRQHVEFPSSPQYVNLQLKHYSTYPQS